MRSQRALCGLTRRQGSSRRRRSIAPVGVLPRAICMRFTAAIACGPTMPSAPPASYAARTDIDIGAARPDAEADTQTTKVGLQKGP